jgi:hypothetical protein
MPLSPKELVYLLPNQFINFKKAKSRTVRFTAWSRGVSTRTVIEGANQIVAFMAA